MQRAIARRVSSETTSLIGEYREFRREIVVQREQSLRAAAPVLETQIEVRPLWSTWLCFALVVMLLMVEWLIRKVVTLP